MSEEDLNPIGLTQTGWQMIEVVERMLDLGYGYDEICEVWGLDDPDKIEYMLDRGREEREFLQKEIQGG